MMAPATETTAKTVPSFATGRKAVGRFVNSKIQNLQRNYTNDTPLSSQARAHLAMLRHGFTDQRVRWLNVGYDLFQDWPTDELGDLADDNNRLTSAAVNAISTALQMYAIHQQSKSRGMAWFLDKGGKGGNGDGTGPVDGSGSRTYQSEARSHSFGHDCHVVDLSSGGEGGDRCLRSLQFIEDMPSFTGIEHNLWSLIKLMRSHDVELDYNQFSQDLFDLQFPSVRPSVFNRWSRQYFGTSVDETDGGKQ